MKARSRSRPLLISFSGLDGSGKSTQIMHLKSVLEARGWRVRLMAFWDDVVVLSRFREGFVHKIYKSERGIGAPGKPVERRDKNVRRWYLTIMRHTLYFLDALNLARVLRRSRKFPADAIILDRYIYDQLANLPLHSPVTRAYVQLVRAVVPKPDIAYLLDADPDSARARKPEYPVDFMRECRAKYFELERQTGDMTVIPPLPLEATKKQVVNLFERVTGQDVTSPSQSRPHGTPVLDVAA
jgi:thymidylate kinase